MLLSRLVSANRIISHFLFADNENFIFSLLFMITFPPALTFSSPAFEIGRQFLCPSVQAVRSVRQPSPLHRQWKVVFASASPMRPAWSGTWRRSQLHPAPELSLYSPHMGAPVQRGKGSVCLYPAPDRVIPQEWAGVGVDDYFHNDQTFQNGRDSH